MTTWIHHLGATGPGLRVAVKDLIDVVDVPTTAASPAVAATAAPAESDAPCLRGCRTAGAVIIGKANLHELAYGGTGINQWYGTPVNPLAPDRIPGGSSSGCAVAVAIDEADVAFGTDTGGSVRTPSACCGTVGLKTTYGRIPTAGVRPLAPSLDVVGPMARDVEGVIAGMALLEPGFTPSERGLVIGRVRLGGTHPEIDAAVDALLLTSEAEIVEVELAGYGEAVGAGVTVLLAEAWQVNGHLLESRIEVGRDIQDRLAQGRSITATQVGAAHRTGERWRTNLARAFNAVDVIAWPTLLAFPSRLDEPAPDTRTTNIAVNLAGNPALAIPVPTKSLPASVQLVGAHGSEELLCATGLHLQAAAGSMSTD